MEPIINPAIFWIASICGTLSTASLVVLSVALIGIALLLTLFFIGDDIFSLSTRESFKKAIKANIIASAIALPIVIFCPSQDTVYLMAASSVVTTDNVEAFKESIEKGITFTVETINSLNPAGDNKNVD